MRLSSVSRTAVLAVAAVGVLGSSACIGSFNLTRKVYAFNKSVSEDKWVQEVVFLAFGIVPVYSIAAGIDALILNSIEFWTGENPVALARRVEQEDGRVLVQRGIVTPEGRTMIVEEYSAEQLVSTTTVRHVARTERVTIETRFADGRVDSRTASRQADGSSLIEP